MHTEKLFLYVDILISLENLISSKMKTMDRFYKYEIVGVKLDC